jgi:hypothetical protein
MFNICLDLYKNDADTMVRNGKLLWIWRTQGGIWDPSNLLTGNNQSKQEEEAKLHSIVPKVEEPTQSTEHTDPEIHGM